jgi:phosphoenolpyruvate carboxylase
MMLKSLQNRLKTLEQCGSNVITQETREAVQNLIEAIMQGDSEGTPEEAAELEAIMQELEQKYLTPTAAINRALNYSAALDWNNYKENESEEL